jgi:hypothetical protein
MGCVIWNHLEGVGDGIHGGKGDGMECSVARYWMYDAISSEFQNTKDVYPI